MNWAAMAAIAELIASAGVIVSLIYLAVQIRHQTSENLLSATHELARQINDVFSGVSENSELAEIYLRGIKDYDSLSSVEKVRFSSFFARLMRTMESMYSRHRHNQIYPRIWPGIEESLRDFHNYPGVQIWWTGSSHWYSDEFQTWVSDCVADGRTSNLHD